MAPARNDRVYLVVEGCIGDGAAVGVDPGIVPGDVLDDDGGGGCVPYGTLSGGSVVLGIADGDMPLGDTAVGMDCGDWPAPGLPGPGIDPGHGPAPGLPKLGTVPGECTPPGVPGGGTYPGPCGVAGRPVCAKAAVAAMIRTKAASVHMYFMGLHIRNRGATMPR